MPTKTTCPPEKIPEGYKRCWTCGKVKPLDAFGLNTNYPDGRSGRCKECRKELEYNNRGVGRLNSDDAERMRVSEKITTDIQRVLLDYSPKYIDIPERKYAHFEEAIKSKIYDALRCVKEWKG